MGPAATTSPVTSRLELDLDANLVVLSACSTGAGRVQSGEGALWLAAFLYAGVQDCLFWIEASCPVDLRIARVHPITRQLFELAGVPITKTGTRLDDVYLIQSRDPEGAGAFLRPEMQSVL